MARARLILTEDKTRRHFLPAPSNRESLTVVEAISAGGTAILAMVIISGVMHQALWYDNLYDNTVIGVRESGYTNDELTLKWLSHFNPMSSSTQVGAYRLRLMDGYGSHYTMEVVQHCDEHKIIPFALPSHTTHVMQPPDVVVFPPYKHYYVEAVDSRCLHPSRN